MEYLSRFFLILGIFFILLSLFVHFKPDLRFIGNLPFDMKYEGDSFTLYFPFGSTIVLSIITSLIFDIISRMKS